MSEVETPQPKQEIPDFIEFDGEKIFPSSPKMIFDAKLKKLHSNRCRHPSR